MHRVEEEDRSTLEAIADLATVAYHNAEAHDQAQRAARTDGLTGLLNHAAMQVRVREEIARAKRDGTPLSYVIVDLDDFKHVNDVRGHQAGDEVLRQVAEVLQAALRPDDQVARYGGDEFVLLLPGTDEAGARITAERVRDAIAEELIGACSLGVAEWLQEPLDADALLDNAHRALLVAKRTGKGRVAVANADVERELALLSTARRPPCRRSPRRSRSATTTPTSTRRTSSTSLAASRCCRPPADGPSASPTPRRCCTTSASSPCRTRSSTSAGRATERATGTSPTYCSARACGGISCGTASLPTSCSSAAWAMRSAQSAGSPSSIATPRARWTTSCECWWVWSSRSSIAAASACTAAGEPCSACSSASSRSTSAFATATRPLPVRLATSSARSACSSRASASSGSCHSATPSEQAPISSSAIASRTRSAVMRAPASSVPGSSRTNSSPP